MMGWEAPLMEQHARVICGQGGGHYLNVGFGLGIIDTHIQVRCCIPAPVRQLD
jgi:protein arginine N-methyltransferase 2